jgi:hypothetical protein
MWRPQVRILPSRQKRYHEVSKPCKYLIYRVFCFIQILFSTYYYQVAIQPDKDGQPFRAISEKSYKTKEEAQAILDAVEATGNILNVEAKPRKEPPPLLHDLSSLQQEANKRKGFTADQNAGLIAKPVRKQISHLSTYR